MIKYKYEKHTVFTFFLGHSKHVRLFGMLKGNIIPSKSSFEYLDNEILNM